MTDNEIISQASEEQFNVACDATDASKNILSEASVIKALECCRGCNCKECPCCRVIDGGMHCTEIDEEEILDLINRQKAEIERLQKANDSFCEAGGKILTEIKAIKKEYPKEIAEAKSEAIKEFAERLKSVISISAVQKPYFDNLVKEMTENEGKV